MAEEKKKRGRKPFNIDWEQAEKLARAHATGASIARLFGMKASSFYRAVEKKFGVKYSDWFKEQKETGTALVALKAYEEALEGGVAMMFWLKCKGGWQEKQIGDNKLTPALIQVNIGQGANVDSKEIELINTVFNGRAILDTGLSQELGSLPERSETDN